MLEILAMKLFAIFFNLQFFLRFLEFPQNKILYFKDDCKYAKYMLWTVYIYLHTNDFVVLIAKHSLLNVTIKFSM